MLFLLDTNILLSLISEPKEEEFLNDLERLIDSDEIKLLVPEILLKEWNKKKVQTITHISKTFSSSSKHSHNKLLGFQFNNDLSHVEEKTKRIDLLLSKGINIPLRQRTKIYTADRATDGKAPFHGEKTKSIKDALIYFSTIQYLEAKNIKEFVFVTRDMNDYGDPLKKENLHPELLAPTINILFFPALGKCLPQLVESEKISYKRTLEEGTPKYQITIIKQGKKSFLDYLSEVLLECQGKMKFIPPNIFCRIHPFRTINIRYNYSYYSNFTLHTNNPDLIEFFKNIDINKSKFISTSKYKNTHQNISKLKSIIDTLEQQLVFSIQNIETSEEVYIRPDKSTECDCPVCQYLSLKWNTFLEDGDLNDKTNKTAFVYFQLGNFHQSFSCYYENFKQAQLNKNKILEYQFKFILQWLNNYALFNRGFDSDKIIEEVKEFDTEKEYFSFANSQKIDQELARFFQSGDIISHFGREIKKTTEKIREHYNSQLKASYSNNNNLGNLLSEFSVLEKFTIANCLPYTKFSEFTEICNDFTEGVFLSTALNEYQVSRLKHFNDYILKTLLFYGNADQIIVLFNRYLKKQIKYRKEDGSFIAIVNNYISLADKVITNYENDSSWQGRENFYKIYWNLLLLMAIVDFEVPFIKSCFDKLIPILNNLPKKETHKLNHLASLIHSKGKVLGFERLKKIYFICFETPALHDETIFDSFSEYSEKFNLEFVSTETEFNLFYNTFFKKCEKCNSFHENILFAIYPILSTKFKQKLSELIDIKLKTNFDQNLYYLATIYNILDFKPLFEEYLNQFKLPSKLSRESTFFYLEGEIRYQELNKLMNLVFKNKIQLPKEFIKSLKGISEYYDWLLDMKNFDYRKFNPLWIINYSTKYYLQNIFSYKIIKTKVRLYLLTNNQPTLAYYYTQYVK